MMRPQRPPDKDADAGVAPPPCPAWTPRIADAVHRTAPAQPSADPDQKAPGASRDDMKAMN